MNHFDKDLEAFVTVDDHNREKFKSALVGMVCGVMFTLFVIAVLVLAGV